MLRMGAFTDPSEFDAVYKVIDADRSNSIEYAPPAVERRTTPAVERRTTPAAEHHASSRAPRQQQSTTPAVERRTTPTAEHKNEGPRPASKHPAGKRPASKHPASSAPPASEQRRGSEDGDDAVRRRPAFGLALR